VKLSGVGNDGTGTRRASHPLFILARSTARAQFFGGSVGAETRGRWEGGVCNVMVRGLQDKSSASGRG